MQVLVARVQRRVDRGPIVTSESTCARCGERFTPAASLLEKFPGWEPRECSRCFRSGKKSGGARASGAGATGAGNGPRAARSRSKRPSTEGRLTLAEVLETYSDGPDSGVFTDGSAMPNPGPGGWGAVYVVDGIVRAQDNGHEPQTTNNRMELRALLAAVDLVPEGEAAVIYSDSNLSVRTVNEWAAGWAARGWRRRTGAVENLDLVRPLYERFHQRPELELVWIRAHVGNRWNEYADALATAWARDER